MVIDYLVGSISNGKWSRENNNFNENDINKIKEIIKLIKQPQQLLNKDENIRLSFCKSPVKNHKIFKPLFSNLNSINDIINTIDNSSQLYKQLIDQFKIYSESQKAFCPQLVGKLNLNLNEEPLQYLNELPHLFNEIFEKYEVKSIQLAYNMASYDPSQYNYIKNNQSGNSIGTVFNNVYFKYDKGGQLLKPAKEFAIYLLYKDLFPLSSSTFVTPTQLIVLDNLKILSEDSTILKKLGSLKTQYNQQDVEIILEKHPEFRTELINALENSQPFFIQSSLFVKGQTLQKLLKDNQDDVNQDFNYEQIDMESYSTHIIASLLVIHSDYKPDNLILQEGTNRIIGIDNDESLCDIEIKGNKTQIRNILFTFKTLMDKSIYQSIRDQFIKHDPYIFIFKWLLQLESKQLEYDKLIQLMYEFKIFNDDNERQTIIKNKKDEINIPLVFRKNWIPSMLDRFKKIKKLLIIRKSINHRELFQSIHPTSYNYYKFLLNKYHNKPLYIIEEVYYSPINVDLIDKNQNYKQEEYQPNIKESILELIKSKNYDENEDINILKEWILLVFNYLKANQIEDFQFHNSWYSNNINILFKILKYGFSKDILESIISKLNITNINQVFSYIIHNQSNHNVCDNIEFLFTKFKIDIADRSLINENSLLDMALKLNDLKGNFKFFLAFLKLGSNKSINEEKFNNFYQSLSHEQKLELKPYLLKLFNINNKINWNTSINQLFPKINNLSDQNNPKILTTISGDKRVISELFWNQLFSSDGIPNKCNDYGSRSVVFISDEYGNGIYVKFYPQLPGTEIAINKLSELLFGFLTPICELASIDNIPILLIQQIPGEPLIDALKKDKDIINKIESSNLSKQLVFAMISNNGDGNLANFIVVPNDTNNESYNIYSIDNDQSFMPSISKTIGYFKNSIQVETVLLLFNQMNDRIHHDVIDCLKDLDVNKTLNNWLLYLNPQHDLAIDHFKNIRIDKNNKETIIGVLFHNGMISQLYSKLKRIKQILNKPKSSSITHLNILEIIEPLVNDRYKPIISINISIIEKLNKLKSNKFVSEKSITSSTNTSNHILGSRTIHNANDIHNQLINRKYGPSQALNELVLLNNQILNLERQMYTIRNIDKNQIQISKYDLECFLKSNLIEINDISILNKLYELIKLKELSIIYLMNIKDLNNKIINQFNLDSIVKLDLSGCNMLESLENYSYIKPKIFFKSLIKLNLKNCSQLNKIKISAPVLKSLNAMNCKQLKIMDVEIPNIEYMNIKGSISKYYINISKTLENFKKIEYLNLSETDYETLTINFEKLKTLDISSMENLNEIYFETPSIESINFEGCNKLKEIKSLKNDYYINFNLLKILYDPNSNFNFLISVYPIEYLNGELLFDLEKSKSISSIAKHLIIGKISYKTEKDLSKWGHKILLKKFNNYKSSFDDLGLREILNIIPSLLKKSFEKILLSLNIYVCEHIEIWHLFDKQLKSDMISHSIENLYLGKIQFPLTSNSIPSSVKKLKLLEDFNQNLIPGIIPNTITHLYIGTNIESYGIISASFQLLRYGILYQPLPPGIIPSSVKSLTFGEYFNQPLLLGTIPSSVQSLTFGCLFNQPLLPGIIPSSVQSLAFGYNFNQLLPPGIIPSSVQSITFGDRFNQPLSPGTIPSSVRSLTFGFHFNQPLSPGTIPSSVQSLTFGHDFNQPLSPGIIPSSAQSLTFGNSFNQPLPTGTIPSSVQSLTFGEYFNQPLSLGIIPWSVQSLTFGYDFNQPLSPGTIPSSVQSLTFGDRFNQPLSPGTIPSSVQSLTFGDCFNQPLSPGTIPSSVRSLTFGYWFNQTLSPGTIPSSVQSLTFGYDFYQPLSFGAIPSSVQSLTFGVRFNQTLSPGTIPSSVQSLTFGGWFNQPLSPGTIPSSVQSLTFGYYFNQPLSFGAIPSSVQSLTFGYRFNQPLLIDTIPPSVQSLTFGYNFNQPLSPGTIPSGVQSLTFGYCFNQPLSPGTIPSSVQSLTFGDCFNQPLSPGTIPSSVQSLKLGKLFNQP